MGSSIPSPTLSSCSLSEFYHGIQGLPQAGILKELVKMFKMRKQKKKNQSLWICRSISGFTIVFHVTFIFLLENTLAVLGILHEF